MVEVATSLLSANEENIIRTLYDLEVAKTDYFHIDVMDGKFVEDDTTLKMRKYTEYIKSVSSLPVDVHLMVDDVEMYVESYLAMDVNCISFQIEACKKESEIPDIIAKIKENNCKVGIAISPKTTIDEILEYIPYIHKVTVMTVEPGKGGQEFMQDMMEKVIDLNKYIYDNGYEVDIEVDGGINDKTAKEVIEAGANILVAGSYIVNSENYSLSINKLKQKEA